MSDYYENETTLFVNNPVNVFNFTNCIIYGSNQVEFFIDRKGTHPFLHKFTNCLIRLNNINNQFTNNPLYNFSNNALYENCSIATNSVMFRPEFEDVNNNKLWLAEDLKLPANATAAALFPLDILEHSRLTSTDLGAYQFVP